MDMRWSMDELYKSIDSKEFDNDLSLCDEKLSYISSWTKSNLNSYKDAKDKIENFLKMKIDFLKVFTKLITYANLSISVNARNEEAIKSFEKLQIKYTEFTKPLVTFKSWIKLLDNLDSLVNSSDFLKEHEFYLKEIKLKSNYLLSDREEIIISKMINTGSKAWMKLYEKLVSTLLVDIDSEQLPLSVVRNLAYDKDKDIRKKAYEMELKSYKRIEDSSASCLNGIKGEVITLSSMRGFSSPLEETLINSRMDAETLDTMMSAVVEDLSSFHKYFKRKAEILGHKNGLPFYDLFAPIGDIDIKFTYKQAQDFIVDNFRTFSTNLSDFAYKAFKNKWIDAEPREGKSGGAFCSSIHSIGESRILSNFDGSFSSVTTLAHELGHAYHGSLLSDQTILNTRYPMPIAETASTFCETIVINAALSEANDKEALCILESLVSDAGQIVVDIYSRYLFESEVFKRRQEAALSVDEFKEIMINSQKTAYGCGIDDKYLHPYMWIAKSHYYSSSRSFYNFPYTFGLLFAKGLYSQYLKLGSDFVKEYDNLLSYTGKDNIYNICKTAGFDIHSIDFWRESLALVKDNIDSFIIKSK
ncbi:oligoendopeptidase F-like protein [Gottschalkia acidurici 9a]|uniref:Oligoendopeptidase F-like protein n=1 Tax=Gottschalkia acidurici (strain ATCC 7906 / DSM 604 / BCRC 14475 / CIP 104303 / KCTC 5404 / NCIMB 10678 / 9a) TaxID=1128398 RepID=K0AWQ1_GOTA9|nr:M3 family oligoendopeptidase [Gottschalkia acidurici]AFS77664.1 oligoendopeptidase F-like protein [Gottschalkia acidurici 9a]